MSGRPIGLAVFDLDGTVLRDDTVCEAIARRMGHLERMRELELLHDLADIAAGRAELAHYYQAVTRGELHSFLTSLRLAPGVTEGFRLLREEGVQIALASVTWEFAVEWFARMLGADYYLGTGLGPDGHITHVWPADKARFVAEVAQRLGLTLAEVAAVGDSWGDIEMLRAVGLPFFVGEMLPTGLERALHCPAGDMHVIAQQMIDASRRRVTAVSQK